MKTKRTDPHRPGTIIPADYVYSLSFWYGSSECPDGYGLEDLAQLCDTHPRFRDAEEANGRCDVCGSRYTHGGAFVHRPTGQTILVGRDCAAKYGMLVNFAGFDAVKEMAKRATAAALTARRNRTRREAFLAANSGLSESLTCGHRITNDLSDKLTKYGSLSEAQINLAHKLHSELWCPVRPREINVPAPEGRVTVRGTIVKADSREGFRGEYVIKITVKVVTDAGTWLCWGTAPRALLDAAHHAARGNAGLKGLEVAFTATLKRGRDAHFALFSRPTGGDIVNAQGAMEQHFFPSGVVSPRPGVAGVVCEQMNVEAGL